MRRVGTSVLALVPEPAHLLCGLSCFYIFACMRIVFLDEFGHIGPFISRSHPKHKTSPVFGLSGFIMPDHQVRAFSTWFFKLKQAAFADDIANSSRHPSAWEKRAAKYSHVAVSIRQNASVTA